MNTINLLGVFVLVEDWYGLICIYCWEYIAAKGRNDQRHPNNCPKTARNEVQHPVISNTLKMIPLPVVFAVGKGRYIPSCVLWSFFAASGKNVHKFLNNHPKTVNKHGVKFFHLKCIKRTHSQAFCCQGALTSQNVFWSYFLVPIGRKKNRNPNTFQ